MSVHRKWPLEATHRLTSTVTQTDKTVGQNCFGRFQINWLTINLSKINSLKTNYPNNNSLRAVRQSQYTL